MILKILYLSLNKKKIFNKLVDKRIEKINDLDEIVNRNDLIYRCKGKVADKKFNEFDTALDIINKIRNGKKDLADVKKDQENLKYYLDEIKKGSKNQNNKKTLCTILKCSIKKGMKLLNFMMIIH